MRVSAVIPALDEEAEIAGAVAAARAAGADEVVVADGGSADATVTRARAAGADLALAAPRGRGPQLRAGAAAARGEVLWFLHADARPPAGAAAAIRAVLRDGAHWGAFRVRHQPSRGLIRIADLRLRLTRMPYGDQGIFATRAAHDAIGGVPAQPLMEDLEFARRLRARFGPPAWRREEIAVSARRWAARPVRTTLCWWTFPLLYRLGASPERLARWYGRGG